MDSGTLTASDKRQFDAHVLLWCTFCVDSAGRLLSTFVSYFRVTFEGKTAVSKYAGLLS